MLENNMTVYSDAEFNERWGDESEHERQLQRKVDNLETKLKKTEEILDYMQSLLNLNHKWTLEDNNKTQLSMIIALTEAIERILNIIEP